MSLSVHIEKQLGNFTLRADLETAGGVTGLLGASGCGKSLTLRCIAGVERPDRGRIVLDGETLYDSARHVNLPPQRRGVGCLFQSCALFPDMTVRQNILCGLHAERDRARREAILADAVRLLRLEGLENHRPHQLSGGQAQRTALARILVSRPRVLLLDEPFSALDSHLRLQLQMELHSLLRDYGRDVLLVTHSRDEAYRLCDRIAVMDAGRVSPPRPTEELFADPQTVQAARLTGCKNIAPARKAGPQALFVPDWGVTLRCAQSVREDVCAVGVRAHHISPDATENRFPVSLAGEMEDPFEWVIRFRYAQQARDSEPVWWRLPKDARPAEPPTTLGIAPEHVLPLYPGEQAERD